MIGNLYDADANFIYNGCIVREISDKEWRSSATDFRGLYRRGAIFLNVHTKNTWGISVFTGECSIYAERYLGNQFSSYEVAREIVLEYIVSGKHPDKVY